MGATRVVDKSGIYMDGVAGLFHFALCSFLLVTGPDAWRHGRYGPEGQFCCDVEAALVADYNSGMFLAGLVGMGSCVLLVALASLVLPRWVS